MPHVLIINDGVWFSPEDAGKIDRDKQELDLLKQEIKELKDANANLVKQNELAQKEIDLNKQLADIAEKKAETSDQAFNQMKEISHEWEALAKQQNKPGINLWQIIGGILVGVITGALLVK